MRLDTMTPISSGLYRMEDHGAQGRAMELAQGGGQALSAAALAGRSLSGHEAHLAGPDEPPHQCWQCHGEGWVVEDHKDAGTKTLQ